MKEAPRNLALLTDLYQLTMGQGYFKRGIAEKKACFNLFFRKHPFRGRYTVFAGLDQVRNYLDHFHFSPSDIDYLASLKADDTQALFDPDYLRYLANLKFCCDVVSVPEGNLVFPNEPLLRVSGPLIQCQLIETALLNMINFQTLIATKASRIVNAAQGDPVLEFGLRRAQGIDGGLSASRAAFIGGVIGTSNVLAGKTYSIPVKGTHAHSWVMVFEDELEAFDAYGETNANNCVFLVDTYNTRQGVQNAITAGLRLRAKGHKLLGIRLDSGNLAELSREARAMLNQAGLTETAIVASNDLDEYEIAELKRKGAAIDMWGVGTKLVTGFDQPALGGVYKLSAMEDEKGAWKPRIKYSDDPIKTSIPGFLNVLRAKVNGRMVGDIISEELENPATNSVVPIGDTQEQPLGNDNQTEFLLKPLYRDGQYVGPDEALTDLRERLQKNLEAFREFLGLNTSYPVGLTTTLNHKRNTLIEKAKESRHA